MILRQPSNMSDADYARSRGWKPGTRLSGDEGRGSDTIEITAIGRKNVLAVSGSHGRESLWTFQYRDWQETR